MSFKLIDKILLFKYPGEIFAAHKGAVTLTLGRSTQLISFFLKRYELSINILFDGDISA